MEHLIEKAFDYGVPTGLLVIGLVGLYVLLRWLRADVVQPLVASIVALINELRVQLPKQTEELQQQTVVLKRIEKNGCGNQPAVWHEHATPPAA